MESNTPKSEQNPSQKSHRNYIRAQILLRIVASLNTFAAALLMGLNKQSRDIAGFQLSATYNSSPAFKFFVVGNAVACGYSVVSLPFIYNNLVEGYTLPIMDLVSMGLVMASASAATAIGYLGKRGNAHIGWSMVCPYYEKFCQRVGISLFLSYLGFLLFLLICSLSSVYKTRLSTSA